MCAYQKPKGTGLEKICVDQAVISSKTEAKLMRPATLRVGDAHQPQNVLPQHLNNIIGYYSYFIRTGFLISTCSNLTDAPLSLNECSLTVRKLITWVVRIKIIFTTNKITLQKNLVIWLNENCTHLYLLVHFFQFISCSFFI